MADVSDHTKWLSTTHKLEFKSDRRLAVDSLHDPITQKSPLYTDLCGIAAAVRSNKGYVTVEVDKKYSIVAGYNIPCTVIDYSNRDKTHAVIAPEVSIRVRNESQVTTAPTDSVVSDTVDPAQAGFTHAYGELATRTSLPRLVDPEHTVFYVPYGNVWLTFDDGTESESTAMSYCVYSSTFVAQLHETLRFNSPTEIGPLPPGLPVFCETYRENTTAGTLSVGRDSSSVSSNTNTTFTLVGYIGRRFGNPLTLYPLLGPSRRNKMVVQLPRKVHSGDMLYVRECDIQFDASTLGTKKEIVAMRKRTADKSRSLDLVTTVRKRDGEGADSTATGATAAAAAAGEGGESGKRTYIIITIRRFHSESVVVDILWTKKNEPPLPSSTNEEYYTRIMSFMSPDGSEYTNHVQQTLEVGHGKNVHVCWKSDDKDFTNEIVAPLRTDESIYTIVLKELEVHGSGGGGGGDKKKDAKDKDDGKKNKNKDKKGKKKA